MDYIQQFHPELDIYSFAALMYHVFSGNDMQQCSPEDLDTPFIELSKKTKDALRLALDPDLITTPSSVRDFMHMLPGCEKMKFKDIMPVEDEFEMLTRDIEPGDFDDIPDFT